MVGEVVSLAIPTFPEADRIHSANIEEAVFSIFDELNKAVEFAPGAGLNGSIAQNAHRVRRRLGSRILVRISLIFWGLEAYHAGE